jgi:hypothetical protein
MDKLFLELILLFFGTADDDDDDDEVDSNDGVLYPLTTGRTALDSTFPTSALLLFADHYLISFPISNLDLFCRLIIRNS